MKNLLRFIVIAAGCISLAACEKEYGPSSFSLPQSIETLVFSAGQTQSFAFNGENIKVCTAKPPKGWYATVIDNMVKIVAPNFVETEYVANGNVSIYARGYDDVEHVVQVPVQTEARLDKKNWKIIYKTCEEAMDYKGQNFTREDDPTSSMTGYATDLIDGSLSSIWVYDYDKDPAKNTEVPFYFVIDLGKTYKLSAAELYAQRANKNLSDPTNTVPTRQCGEAIFEFATSINGNGMADKGGTGSANWGNKQTFYSDQLLNVYRNAVHFNKVIEARYIRFTYAKAYYSADDTSPNYKGGALAELNILGY